MSKMKDYGVLRALASELREISEKHSASNQEKLKSWKDLNGLRPSRPMFMIDQIPWNEMNINDELTLQCEDNRLRLMESDLRRQIYRHRHMPDDRIILPEIRIPKIILLNNYGIDSDVTYAEDKESEENVHGQAYNDQLQSEDDLVKIGIPTIEYKQKETAALEEMANEIFRDVIEVKMSGMLPNFHAWDNIVEWHGVNNTILDLLDRPEFMHKIIQRTLDSRLSLLDQLEARNLLDVGNPLIHCTGAYSDELPGYEYGKEKHKDLDCTTAKNMWTYGAAQIFSTVSPGMHDEFDIEYAKQWYERFGLGYYGCCEPLHDKIDIVRKLPNIRKISISPWADREKAASLIDGDYVMSLKPTPAIFACDMTWKEKDIVKDLEKAVRNAEKYNCNIELILKDISTVDNKPERLFRWAEIAKEICGMA